LIDKDTEGEGPDRIEEVSNHEALVQFQFETGDGYKEEDPLIEEQKAKAEFNNSY
jgi:hypothetical protein